MMSIINKRISVTNKIATTIDHILINSYAEKFSIHDSNP